MMCSVDPVQLQPAFEGCYTPTSTNPDDLNEYVLSYLNDNPESGSDDSNRELSEETCNTTTTNNDNVINERKLRRMISNRLSAQRSRWRKKRHLENLTVEVNRMKAQNREMKSQLELVRCQCYVVKKENERLKCESVLLKQRLSYLRQTLLAINQLQNNQQLFKTTL